MKKSKEACSGCYNDDYNRGLGGAKECWSYKSAKIIKRLSVHVNQMPPFNAENAEPMMSCFNRPQWCCVSPDALTSEGYWK